MLITEFVDVKVTPFNIEIYKKLGYDVKINEHLTIPVEQLTEKSIIKVEVECDYCGKRVFKQYMDFLISRQTIPKDACKKCSSKKTKETNLFKYGVEHTNQLQEVKDKRISNSIEKYGVDYYSQTDESKKRMSLFWENLSEEELENRIGKTKLTCLDKYGTESYTQTDECKKRHKNTCLERKK